MSSKSGMFQASSGYAQQGGAYYLTISSIAGQLLTYTPGTGSGGATTVGSFANFSFVGGQASVVGANRVIRDMGKTVVSAGRTFRKFQGVIQRSASTSGVVGNEASTTNPGYLTGYLEIAKDGNAGEEEGTALIVRYA
jgi:hypothetical protein